MSRKTIVRRISTIGTTSSRRVMRYVLSEVPVTGASVLQEGRPELDAPPVRELYGFEISQNRM